MTWLAKADWDDARRGSFSFYKNTWGCLRRQTRGMQARTEGEDWDAGEDASLGKDVHRFLEAYHQNLPRPQLEDEASTLARRYEQRFAPESFGRVICGERKLAMIVADEANNPWYYKSVIDASVFIDEAAVERVSLERRIVLPGPGRYNIDHKTKKSHTRSLLWEYNLSPQFTGYFLADELFSGSGCMGTLINVLFRYKEDRPEGFVTFYVPPPDERLIREFRYFVSAGGRRRAREGDDAVDPTRCFEWGRACPLLEEGCERS